MEQVLKDSQSYKCRCVCFGMKRMNTLAGKKKKKNPFIRKLIQANPDNCHRFKIHKNAWKT